MQFANPASSKPKTPSTPKTPSAPPPPTAQQKAAVLFNQALQALRAGKRAQAEKLYRQMLEQDPKAHVGWINLALLLSQQERHDEAIAAAQKAVRLAPNEGMYQASLATMEWRAGRHDEALVTSKAALALAPKNVDALRTIAGVLVSQKRFAEAIPYLKTWATVQPGVSQALGALATVQAQARQPAEALETLRTLTKRFPKETNGFLMRGDIAGQLALQKKDTKLFQEARDSYQRAFTLDPKNLQAGYNAAVAAEQAGDVSGTITLLEKLRERSPGTAAFRHSLALAYVRDTRRTVEDRVSLGLKEAEAAVGREPKNPDFAATLGYMVLSQGGSKEIAQRAARVFEGALKLDGKNKRARAGLIEALLTQSEWARAIPYLQEQVKETPDDDTLRHRLAATLLGAGRRSEAAAELRTIARRNPKDTKTLRELAQIFEQDGQLVEAEKTLEEAAKLTPDDLELTLARAGLAMRQRNFEAAQRFFEAVLTKKSENADAHAGLVSLCEAQGKKPEALTARERWLKADPKNNQARYELGMAYAELGRDDEALTLLKGLTLRKGDPNRNLHRQALAEFYRRKKRYSDEAAELRGLTAEEPGNELLRVQLAEALERAGKLTEAEEVYTGLISRSGNNDLRYNLALIGLHERAGKREQALHELEDLIALRTSSIEARAQLIRLRREQKQPELAAAYFERIALSEPTNPNPNLTSALDELYASLGTPEKFVAFAKKCTESYPKSVAAWRRYAQVQERAKAFAEAALGWQKVGELDPKSAEGPLQLGQVLEAQSKHAEAIKAYTEAAKRERTPAALDALKRLGAPSPK